MTAAILPTLTAGQSEAYPAGSVTILIGTALMTPATTRALRARLEPIPEHPAVLDAHQLAVLAAVATQLLPQSDRADPIDLLGACHHRLATGSGDGWRWASMPNDVEACRRGLNALDAAAVAAHGGAFAAMSAEAREQLLTAVQSGRIAGGFGGIDPARWFTEMLAMLVDIYYAHPVAQAEIGYAGMADARGWPDVAIGARAPHEPDPA